MRLSSIALSLVALASPYVVLASYIPSTLERRDNHTVQLQKRFTNARFTFFDVGLGACGRTNVDSDFVVALDASQFGTGFPGPECFKSITLSANGKTTHATIVDRCAGCPFAGLDLSRGLFDFFAPESVGVLTGTWSFD